MIHQHPVTYAQFGYTVLLCFVIVGVVGLAYTAACIVIHRATHPKPKKEK